MFQCCSSETQNAGQNVKESRIVLQSSTVTQLWLGLEGKLDFGVAIAKNKQLFSSPDIHTMKRSLRIASSSIYLNLCPVNMTSESPDSTENVIDDNAEHGMKEFSTMKLYIE